MQSQNYFLWLLPTYFEPSTEYDAKSSPAISSKSSFPNNPWFLQNHSEGKKVKARPKKKTSRIQLSALPLLETTEWQSLNLHNICTIIQTGLKNNNISVGVNFFLFPQFEAAIFCANNFNCCFTKSPDWYSVHSATSSPLHAIHVITAVPPAAQHSNISLLHLTDSQITKLIAQPPDHWSKKQLGRPRGSKGGFVGKKKKKFCKTPLLSLS